MATATLKIGNPVEEGIKLSETLNPLYVKNFKLAMEAVSPGSGAAVAQNIGSMLRGEVPLDVQRQIIQTSAELNLTQGRFGEAANFSTMRNLGKSSAEIQQQGLSNLKNMMPDLPDISTLINQFRSYDMSKAQMDLQESQFQRSLKEGHEQFTASNALDKLRLSLAERAQSFSETATTDAATQSKYQFDTSLAWEKTVSGWNREYETWATTESQNLARELMASKERIAGIESNATTAAMNARSAATAPITVGTRSALGATSQSLDEMVAQAASRYAPAPVKKGIDAIPDGLYSYDQWDKLTAAANG